LLKLYSLYQLDVELRGAGHKVIIVDKNTGRLMTGRRWSDGLHQAVEAKEGVAIERETQTLATITIQNYFRLYTKLAGMTGTAETERRNFPTSTARRMTIPQNRPNVRRIGRLGLQDAPREIQRGGRGDQDAARQGRPVLVGTVSVETSECSRAC